MIRVAGVPTPEDISAQDTQFKRGVLELEVVDELCLKVTCLNQSITLDPRKLEFTPDMAVGYLGLEDKIQLVWDSERFGTRDTAASVVDRKGVADLTNFLFIAGFSGEDLFLITRKKLIASDAYCEVIHIEPDGMEYLRPRLWIASQDQTLLQWIVRNKAKRELLSKINTGDALAALEKQLDLMTGLVVQLAASLAAPPDWLDPLKAVLAQNASTQYKSDAQNIVEIGVQKKQLRALQAQYFAARSQTL